MIPTLGRLPQETDKYKVIWGSTVRSGLKNKQGLSTVLAMKAWSMRLVPGAHIKKPGVEEGL